MASVWSGHLTFGLMSIPVRLFSGARSSGISFNMLNRADKSRLKQQYVSLKDGHVVDRQDIVKGYEFRKDEYIVIEPDEIKKIEPQTATTMEILEFVKAGEVDPVYFESSYFMVAEDAGKQAYALLLQGLMDTQHVAIAKVTMHNREYTVFMRPTQGGLMLHTMYYKEEIKKAEGFGVQDATVNPAQLKVVGEMIEAMADDWDPSKYEDTFQNNLKELVQNKLEGKETAASPKTVKVTAAPDLMAALKQSLAAMAEKKAAKKKKKVA